MLALDTHVWFWLNNEIGRLSPLARTEIERSNEIYISAVSCWELAMLASKGRLEFPDGVKSWIRRNLSRPGVVALPLGPEVATEAALLEGELGGDPADRMIYATARAHGATLVTKDRRIRDYDPRGTLW